MIAALAFDYETEHKEEILSCNLCGGRDFETVSETDRYGLPVRAVKCLACSLVFLNPRMAKAGYSRFYEGEYRRLVSLFHGREISTKTILAEQAVYAEELAQFLSKVPIQRPRTILDIGGSTGVVARHLAHVYRARPTILDPASEELAEAGHDLEIIHGLVENWDPKDRLWGLVTLCQTIDHLLDIAGTLKKLRGCIAHHGALFVDILDYNQTKTIKVDHPYNLTRDTMEAYLQMAGYKVIACEPARNQHVNYLCEVA